MNRRPSISGWTARVLMVAVGLFMVTQFITYVSMKTAVDRHGATIRRMEDTLRNLEAVKERHLSALHSGLMGAASDASQALRQVAQATASVDKKLKPLQHPAPNPIPQPTPQLKLHPPPLKPPSKFSDRPPPPADILDFGDVPWHLLSNQTESQQVTGGYVRPDGQFARWTWYRRCRSLPEDLADIDFTEITRLTGWTKPMLQQQLKLLLQCNGMPEQKGSWIQKLMREFIHKSHNLKADVTPGVASQLMSRETCSALSVSNPEREELLEYFAEFIKLYTDFGARPFDFNPLGQRLTHSFATWFHVRRMQPKYIIESGVHKGHTTWLMRQAAPQARMIMMDPDHTQIAHWDRNADTLYFLGPPDWTPNASLAGLDIRPWRDFTEVDWSFISDEDRAHNTLLLIDDHQDEWDRVKEIRARGFKKAMFDDNWFVHQGDNFSLKQLCDQTAGSLFPNQATEKVLRMANFSMSNKWFPLSKHQEDRAEFMALTRSYFEMPPVLWYPPLILYTQFRTHHYKDEPSNAALVYLTASMVQPPLIQTQEEFDRFGMHVMPLREFWYYMNHCLIELR
mmetsp:Transcript_10842/g.19304  ORF Transcript_10842/g.19304 Transcript_10842/m.19304 type:complete len:568 (-) Transcript_10842:125-1828(-)